MKTIYEDSYSVVFVNSSGEIIIKHKQLEKSVRISPGYLQLRVSAEKLVCGSINGLPCVYAE